MDFDINKSLDSVQEGTREVAEIAHKKAYEFHSHFVSKTIPKGGKFGNVAKFSAELIPGVSEYNAIREGNWKEFAIAAGVDVVAIGAGVFTGGAGTVAVKGGAAGAKLGVKKAVKEIAEVGAKKALKETAETGAKKTIGAETERAVKKAVETGSEKVVKETTEKGVEKASKEVAEDAIRAKSVIPTPRESELRAIKKFGGKEQVSYYKGKEVPYGTKDATRPDIVRETKDGLQAIEVKNYDLINNDKQLVGVLRKQVSDRAINMPENTKQMIVLDVKGRGYSGVFIHKEIKTIRLGLNNVYPKIPIKVLR